MAKISVANDFHKRPAGRYSSDGKYSGERFREEFLIPQLKAVIEQKEKLVIDFEDVSISASSFLEEAFGGLVRLKYFTAEQLKKSLEINSSRKTISEEIWRFIDDASRMD